MADPIHRFTYTRQYLHNAASRCATEWIATELALAAAILARPRCARCFYELNAGAGICSRCGALET